MTRISGLRCWSGAPKKVQMKARNLKSTESINTEFVGTFSFLLLELIIIFVVWVSAPPPLRDRVSL